jgi:hypothetical protein
VVSAEARISIVTSPNRSRSPASASNANAPLGPGTCASVPAQVDPWSSDTLAGEEIPLAARVIAVCDAYDAMTTSRPYRPTPMSPEGALSELRMSAGTQFDPAVVAAFEASLAQRGVSAVI